ENAKTLMKDMQGAAAKKGPQPVKIDAQRLKILGQQNQAIWSGNVKAKRSTTDITSSEMVAFYNENQEVTSMVATGNVEAVDGDRWARGDRADFDNLTGILVMTGNPQAKQGPNRMRGTKVTFHTESDLLDVDNAVTVVHSEKGKVPQLPKGSQP